MMTSFRQGTDDNEVHPGHHSYNNVNFKDITKGQSSLSLFKVKKVKVAVFVCNLVTKVQARLCKFLQSLFETKFARASYTSIVSSY